MTRTKTSPETASSAADGAPAAGPGHDAAAAPGNPAAAVCAALAASPGATVAVIAGAAAIGKPAARDALLAMETAGTVIRVKGGRPGIPDTWALAGPAPEGTVSEAGPEDVPAGRPGEDSGGSPEGAGGAGTAGGAGQDRTTEAGGHAPEGDAEAGTSTAPGSGTGQPEPDDAAAPAEDDHEDAVPDEPDDEAAPGSGEDPDDSDEPRQEDAVPAGGEAGEVPDPALATDLTGRLDQIRAAASAAGLVLTAGGDLKTALAGLDEICEQAAQARRSLKAATGGRKAPTARPGGLRGKVLAHLDANPGKEFTPHEIHKVNGHSSGAIANALETLVKLGEAEVATEKPRRFRRAAQPAGAAAGADDAGSTEQGGTELAGAA